MGVPDGPVPARAGLLDDARDVFFDQVALRREFICGSCDQFQILVAALVALFDRGAWVVSAFAFGASAREWNHGAGICYEFVRRAGFFIIKIPADKSCEWDGDLRHAD